MIINHNISALNTHRQLGANNNAVSNSLEKLSSGLKINRAGDDAAGLAISEKMRGQIRGLEMATKNSQDAISLIQTAEGALNETHSILQRMRELAVQASNDTNTPEDRGEIQKEIDQLTEEINRISNTTEFNTKKLLNGDSGTKVNFGANGAVASAGANENTIAGNYTIEVTTAAEKAEATGTAFTADDIDASLGTSGTINVNGRDISFDIVTGDEVATANNFINALNNASIGITASGNENGITLTTNKYGADEQVSVKASDLTAAMGLTTDNSTNVSKTGVDVAGEIGGVAATGKGTTLTGTGDATGLRVTLNGSAASSVASHGSVDVTQDSLTMHIGANKDQNMTVSIRSMGVSDLGINDLDLTTQAGANSAIETIDNATKEVSAERAKLGAMQNRLEHTINNLGASAENLTAAESRIRDVDMAKEMMEFTKNNILTQAAQAMLAQANQTPQGVLQLLR